jgi:flagellar hook-basal body complex protein FliE
MDNKFIPSVDLTRMITNNKIDTGGPEPFRLAIAKPVDETTKTFSDVMAELTNNIDETAKKPDKMIAEAMVNPNIDIHDVMIAVNQSEITLTIATQATTKLIQGYEKIISMQV